MQHVTKLKSLVNIDILIVKKENTPSKTSTLYVRAATEKFELIDLPLAEKKFHNFKNVHFEKKYPRIKSQKKIFFSLTTTFYNFPLEIETSLAKKLVKASLKT